MGGGELEKVKEEKMMQKSHRLELEKRDRKEIVMMDVVVAVCVFIYACVMDIITKPCSIRMLAVSY